MYINSCLFVRCIVCIPIQLMYVQLSAGWPTWLWYSESECGNTEQPQVLQTCARLGGC